MAGRKNWARGGRVYTLSAGGLKPVAPMVEKEFETSSPQSLDTLQRFKESVARLPVPDGTRSGMLAGAGLPLLHTPVPARV